MAVTRKHDCSEACCKDKIAEQGINHNENNRAPDTMELTKAN
jgi:hypothetical protein